MREHAAHVGTDDRGQSPNRAEQPERGAAPLDRNAIGDRGRRHRKDAARARGLDAARHEEHREVGATIASTEPSAKIATQSV
jgi:hypothetical protein